MSATPDTLGAALREELVALAAPLTAAAQSPEGVARLLRAFGRGDDLARSAPLQAAIEQVVALMQRIGELPDDALGSWSGIFELLKLAGAMFDALRALDTLAESPDLAAQAEGLGRELAEQLLALHLRNRHATLFRVSQLLTLVTPTELAAAEAMVEHDGKPVRLGTRRDRFHFDRVGALLDQPLPTLAQHYFPNGLAAAADAHLGAARLFPLLRLLAQEIGLSSFDDQRPTGTFTEPAATPDAVDESDHFGPEHDDSVDPSPDIPTPDPVDLTLLYESNRPRFVAVLPGLVVDGKALPARLGVAAELSSARHPGAARGLIVKPLGLLALSESRGGWRLTINGQGELPGWLFGPDGAGLAPAAAAPAAASVKLAIERETAPGTPAFVFGAANGSRLEIGALKLGLEAEVVGTRATLAAAIDASSGAVVLAPDDGFLGSLVPAGGLRGSFDLGLGWSSDAGLALRGGAGLEVRIAVGRSLGGLTLKSLRLGLLARNGSIVAAVSAEVSASIGPVKALVDGVGVQARIDFPDGGGNLGVAELDIGPTLPSGIGLVVEAHGVLTGGGFLFRDEAQSLYAGAMELSLHEFITLKAFGLIATRLPDGSPGYSLLVFITAEDFRIQLGLGFTLNGIGGMVAIHRTFDVAVLREGLKSGMLATLLFPRDPVGNAPALIRSLALAFPARRGSYLLGLLLRIGWGTPTLVRFDLGLILEFGARRRLLVLGRISALLPSEHNDLVRLNMEALGVIDFDAGTTEIDAVLVDSRLAHQFAITGSMALRARWGSGPGPAFILALGGLHPRFTSPAGLPKLERLTIALSSGDNPRLTCAAYFAITANTVQYGARAQLYAAAGGFSVQGDVGYDVLLQISPLHFIADFRASLQLKRGSHNLFKVSLQGELEGPRPLRVSGKATFEILWCDFSVRFDKTLVAGEKPPLPPAVDVLAELERALAAPSSWSTQVPTGHAHGVALCKLPADDRLVLDPLGRLTVRQQVVPLNTGRDIDRFGGSPLAGARRFSLAAAIGGAAPAVSTVQDDFAPAQFFEMSDDDKLAAPSFERMDAGIAFGSEAVGFDAAEAVAAPLDYEEIVVDDLHVPSPPPQPYVLDLRLLTVLSRTGSAARASLRRIGRSRFRGLRAADEIDPADEARRPADNAVNLRSAAFAVVALDAAAAAAPTPQDAATQTFSASRDMVRLLNRAGARFLTVPLHELVD